jgi:hypothetical protein
MWDWVSSRPHCCLKIGVDSVAWAEVERNWRGRRRHRCAVSPVPDGAVKPSPAEQNLADPAELESRIRTLTGPSPQVRVGSHVLVADLPRPIVLLVPDAAVRAVVLQLDQLPSRGEEREALIRWRLGQEQLFPLSGAKVVSQVFSGALHPDGPSQTVLAVAIQESVLAQYESLCESLGLIPQDVGMTSLRLVDLWRRAAGGSQWQRRNVLWVNLTDRALTTMVFQRGQLLFYRCKLLGHDASAIVAKTDMLHKIVEECGASLDACQQRYPKAAVKEAVICADGDLSALQAQVEAELDLSVEQSGWRSLEGRGRATNNGQRTVAALAALAGVS